MDQIEYEAPLGTIETAVANAADAAASAFLTDPRYAGWTPEERADEAEAVRRAVSEREWRRRTGPGPVQTPC